MQARAKGSYNPEAYEVYLGSICPDSFAWILPESKSIARIGVASRSNAKEIFRKFLKGKNIQNKQIIDFQAGLIPIYDKKLILQKRNVFLVGDAACQVKATTGGGLVPGLKAAKILADSIIKNKSYKKRLADLNKELWIHLKIRQMLNKFSDRDYNNLIDLIKNKKIINALNRYGRDNPKQIVLKAILSEPSLLKYIIKFIN